MTYPEIIREIGKRADDPELKKSRAIAGNLFVESLINVILDEKTDIGQIGDFYKTIKFALESGSWNNYTQNVRLQNDILKTFDVSLAKETYLAFTSPVSLKKISSDSIERMNLEDSFRPSGTEIFWHKRRASTTGSKNVLEFFISREYYNADTLQTVPLEVDVYISPKLSDFTSTNNDVLDEYNLGTKVVYDSISLASVAIMSLTKGSK